MTSNFRKLHKVYLIVISGPSLQFIRVSKSEFQISFILNMETAPKITLI